MKKLLPFLLSFSGIFTFSQQIESSETILNDKISIRAIE
ncbi:glycosyl hydrolase, partial [Chryseobacterium sp. HMWF001]